MYWAGFALDALTNALWSDTMWYTMQIKAPSVRFVVDVDGVASVPTFPRFCF
jgi:hypothetical protein